MAHQRLPLALAIVALTVLLPSCRGADSGPEADTVSDTASAASPAAPVMDVAAVDYAFQAPPEIPSGWTTIRMENAGAEPHFLLLTRLPDGKTIEAYGQEVGMVFDEVWKRLASGTIDKAEAGQELGQRLPDWYLTSAVPMGGPGLVHPGAVAETTIRLEPGYYVMECYVKTAEGEFHASLGMVRPVVVTDQPSGGSAPASDVAVTLSNDGIDAPGTLAPGRHVIAVHFQEHPEAGLGNDVHLARLDEGTGLDTVTRWMDWMELDGLRHPAPVEFLGGAEEMPAGATAYFAVDVSPGRYAWITETTPDREMAVEVMVQGAP